MKKVTTIVIWVTIAVSGWFAFDFMATSAAKYQPPVKADWGIAKDSPFRGTWR